MSEVAIFDSEAVLAAVSPPAAIERTRLAFERHAEGDWVMPAKVYVEAPPGGDFRAMPARGAGLATLKWVTSFPANPERGLPVVAGALLVSDAETGALLAIADCAAVTSLRTGAAAAVSALTLAREGAATVGLIGCGVNGAWAARCLAAAGYGPGICADARAEAADALAGELGWQAGPRELAAAQDVVVTVTPADRPVIGAADLRPGQHLAVLGADAAGKAEVELAALDRCRLFCDEWEQASKGGELSGAVAEGAVGHGQVTEIGEVLLGRAPGREADDEITLFDSTGLAIQDLAIASALLDAWRAGEVDAPSVNL
jgi:ornithine cyclodeaminase/alanine dehydrogenase-like protein (mu-crystallin family)